MIDWATIETAIVSVTAAALGLPTSSVRWAAPDVAVPARPCAVLDWLSRDRDLGNPARNEQRLPATPGTAQIVHWRGHTLTVDYLAELPGATATAGTSATAAIGKLARVLHTSGPRATLRAAGLALTEVGDPRDVGAFVGTRFETRAVLEIEFTTVDTTADAVGKIVTVTGPAGP